MKQGWIEDEYKNKLHYVNGKLHNDNGPAVIFSTGSKEWYKNGLLHREDGPASEYSYGKKSWWYEGKFLGYSWNGYTQKQFERWKKFKAFL